MKHLFILCFALLAFVYRSNPVYADSLAAVNGDNVNVHAAGSQYSNIRGQLNYGQQVIIVGKAGDFFRISINETDNLYVYKNLLTIQEATGTITADRVNIRRFPSTYHNPLSQAFAGDTFRVISRYGDWFEIIFNSGQAFVHSDFITGYFIKYVKSVTVHETAYTPSYSDYVNPNEEVRPKTYNSMASDIVAFAKQFIGTPYAWGGTNLTRGVDCSGFVFSVMRYFGIQLNRSSRDQFLNGHSVSRYELQPADLVFFSTDGRGNISHVGIYIGGCQFIHAASFGRSSGVTINSLNEDYYIRTYRGARRVL